jgi:hypothetical protein
LKITLLLQIIFKNFAWIGMVRRMFSVIRLARHLAVLATVVGSLGFLAQGLGAANRSVPKVDQNSPRNIIFVLADDHRFDAMGFA